MEQVRCHEGIFVALDQSCGATPRMLRLYGIDVCDYFGEPEMLDRAHAMRSRILSSPTFGGPRVLGAILFEDTVEHEICGLPAARYLWETKRVVPFLKVDRGLFEERGGVQLMRDVPQLDAVLDSAAAAGIFGTKTRSLIKSPNVDGIRALVHQQLDLARHVLARGLVPVLEPEVAVGCPEKARCEQLLLDVLLESLRSLGPDDRVIFRLTIPCEDDLYLPLVEHPNVLRVVALGGGLSQADVCARLARNRGVAACFSRAFLEGLHAGQTQEAFESTLEATCKVLLQASSGSAAAAAATPPAAAVGAGGVSETKGAPQLAAARHSALAAGDPVGELGGA